MKITNKAGVHDVILEALRLQDKHWYGGHGEDRFASVTELLKPPSMVALEREHKDELEEEAIDCLWRLRGAALHKALDNLLANSPLAVEGKRFLHEFNGVAITGGPDVVWEAHEIIDFKDTSAWHVVFGRKRDGLAEWAAQLNMYAYMAQAVNLGIDKLTVVAFLRDWDGRKCRDNPDYPRQPCLTIDIPLWAPSRVEAFAEQRIDLFRIAFATAPAKRIPCSPEERWEQPTTWALKEEGKKRAAKVFKSEAEAKADPRSSKPKFHLEERLGGRRRCEQYCSVSKFCADWKAYQKSTLKS